MSVFSSNTNSSSSSSSFDEPFKETSGPRVGLSLSLDQANTILTTHLNLTCTKLDYINRGYNNRTYIASASNGFDYIIRLSGRFWNRWKTEREVATILYIQLSTNEIPVPKIYGWCSNKEASGVNSEYILMEKLNGVPLENIWSQKDRKKHKMDPQKLTNLDKSFILDQIASILKELQCLTFKQIGSLCFVPEIGNTFGLGINPWQDITLAHIMVGQQSDIMGGPFTNYIEYEKSSIESAIKDMKNSQFMESSWELVPKIKAFLESQFKAGSKLFSNQVHQVDVTKPSICLIHGDFEPRNIMIDPHSLVITGVVDWEFSGAFPFYQDWFGGFQFVGCICDEEWTYADDDELLAVIHDGGVFDDDDDYDPNNEESIKNREIFFESLTKYNLPNPAQIPHLKTYAILWNFGWNISPWFFSGELREPEHPDPIKREKVKEKAKKIILKVLQRYNCL